MQIGECGVDRELAHRAPAHFEFRAIGLRTRGIGQRAGEKRRRRNWPGERELPVGERLIEDGEIGVEAMA